MPQFAKRTGIQNQFYPAEHQEQEGNREFIAPNDQMREFFLRSPRDHHDRLVLTLISARFWDLVSEDPRKMSTSLKTIPKSSRSIIML